MKLLIHIPWKMLSQNSIYSDLEPTIMLSLQNDNLFGHEKRPVWGVEHCSSKQFEKNKKLHNIIPFYEVRLLQRTYTLISKNNKT